MVTAALYAAFAALTSALTAIGRPRQSVAMSAPGDFVFYTLDVAFTPYGPEILSFWMPTTVAIGAASEMRRGDMQ